jgi:hypothetical protein
MWHSPREGSGRVRETTLGVAQAYMGYSGLATALSMPASAVLLVWLALVDACRWRRAAPAL